MKTIELKLSGPPCISEYIKRFELFADASLPSAYSDFLLRHNGGIPSPLADTFQSTLDLPGGSGITVHQFYSLSHEHPPLKSLFHELEADVGFMPMTSIPIGEDSHGNVIGIDCETGLLNWTVCEERFHLDYLRNFELGISFDAFLNSLEAGPYASQT
jgi:hypothetical protein